MRFSLLLPLLIAVTVLPTASLRAQNVEVSGWRPSDWRLVPSAQAAGEADVQSGSVPANASRISFDWVRWGITESTAAVAEVNGNLSVRASSDVIPEGCSLAGGNGGTSANSRAFSSECVAAAALSRGRQAEARAGLQWVRGPVSLTATAGLANAAAPLTESLNPLGSLPVWLLDDSLRIGAAGSGGVEVRTRDVAVRGDWRVNSSVSVHLMGSRGELTAAARVSTGQRVEAEQTVLGFGITRGSLSGTVTGQRVVPSSPLRANEGVTALDLGVSWRTPWQGELTVGARELSRSGAPLADPAQAAKVREERTPYVQYRQDL